MTVEGRGDSEGKEGEREEEKAKEDNMLMSSSAVFILEKS